MVRTELISHVIPLTLLNALGIRQVYFFVHPFGIHNYLPELQSVRQDFIVPVNSERREMVGNIILSFSTLAASFRLKAPLPPYLPPVEKSRLRLVRRRIP